MFGNDSDVIPKGFYGMANKYFSAFLKAAFEFEISDTSKPSRFDALFDEVRNGVKTEFFIDISVELLFVGGGF